MIPFFLITVEASCCYYFALIRAAAINLREKRDVMTDEKVSVKRRGKGQKQNGAKALRMMLP
jgi:hypothetical protein